MDHLDTMGISRHGHHLCWGTDGIGRRWLPVRVKRWLVHRWNHVACRVWGHDWAPIDCQWPQPGRMLLTVGCTGCCKPLGRMLVADPFPPRATL